MTTVVPGGWIRYQAPVVHVIVCIAMICDDMRRFVLYDLLQRAMHMWLCRHGIVVHYYGTHCRR